MAESSAESSQTTKEGSVAEGLKYLAFVQVAVIQAAVMVARLYGHARESAGPLKPGVQHVEGTVKAVVGPVYDRLHDVPLELLKFVDRKVDDAVHKIEQSVPAGVKEAYATAQKAPEVVRSVAGEVQRAGVVGTASGVVHAAYARYEPTARELYTRYEPVAERCAVSAWQSLNQLPLVPQVAGIVVPTAAHWSERYNQAVSCAAERGYTISAYMPLVPVEKIAKVFGNTEEVAAGAE